MQTKGDSTEEENVATLVGRMRTGQLSNGDHYTPFLWLYMTGSRPKLKEEMRVERAMESCTFKTGIACVGGINYIQVCLINIKFIWMRVLFIFLRFCSWRRFWAVYSWSGSGSHGGFPRWNQTVWKGDFKRSKAQGNVNG